jgi:hypothetical protein
VEVFEAEERADEAFARQAELMLARVDYSLRQRRPTKGLTELLGRFRIA